MAVVTPTSLVLLFWLNIFAHYISLLLSMMFRSLAGGSLLRQEVWHTHRVAISPADRQSQQPPDNLPQSKKDRLLPQKLLETKTELEGK